MITKVHFERNGVKLVGNLYAPPTFDGTRRFKAVIVVGSFTSVKEQMAGTYAEKFAQNGLVALAFDYGRATTRPVAARRLRPADDRNPSPRERLFLQGRRSARRA